jgi:hypothetical protein
MANAINWESSPALVSYLTTELNSLANAARVIGAAIDNSSGLDMYMDVEAYVAAQGSARSAGAYLGIYLIPSLDGGTNYGYGDATDAPPASGLVAALPLDAATTARRVQATMIPVPPGHFKLIISNATGQAFAAADSTLAYRLYSTEVQ